MTGIRDKIANKFENSEGFLPYIEEIRFPMYKSLLDGLTVQLNWPIVALVGPNGTNKSSVLQAISAAPEGRSLAEFWFSTEVDDIDQGPRAGATHRFIYKYRFERDGPLAECRKYRGSKKYRSADVPAQLRGKRDPDYWEPTKRVESDGMAEIPASGYDDRLSKNRDRWNQIQKNVLYLDFRSELSAFDKFIHHQAFNHWTPDATQKRYKAVLWSRWIARALSDKSLPKAQRKKLIKPVRFMAAADITAISTILGKPIDKVAIVEHRFFGPTGYTVRLHLEGAGATYSEAHAGSGEYAVVRLVDAIRRAQARSLILLDEPEVSLHPGAQIELMKFVEREVLEHGHQVVISTHSPSLAERLPDEAIKVFGFDNSRQRVVLVADGCSPTEAFAHLGQTTAGPTRPRLIVEDELAAEIVRASLRRHAPTKFDTLDVVPFPGGADGIVQNVLPTFAVSLVEKCGILLDGDQQPATADPTRNIGPAADAARAQSDTDALTQLWFEQFHKTRPNLYSDSGGGRDAEILHACIGWANLHLGFLPGRAPEEALALEVDPSATKPPGGWKSFWEGKVRDKYHLTDHETVTSKQILEFQSAQLADLAADCDLLRNVHATVARIINW
ncbi:AAA family ATPase [Mycobacterium sp. 852002-51961_SCH5331710]|uniref:AAA family ATPase n=1 Tax=Mycobacterium sp. 852002-51961_SCH5331710 TaxID=1834105 RepID=UPI0012E790C7|nr:AAA family ATPase [Mycobacterium sp. 852002-51961_SCH5331710]